jgi:hypothetical protein
MSDDCESTAGVTSRQRMVTPPWLLLEVRVVLHSTLFESMVA